MRGLIAFLTVVAATAASLPGDAERGRAVFTNRQCVTCHSIAGEGGKTAPDLGRGTGRGFTSAELASILWNHAPEMWKSAGQRGVKLAPLSRDEAADLYAYFYAARFFERPGDAARGKRLFTARKCAGCHSLSAVREGGPRPVSAWRWLNDPIGLAAQMWNHASEMPQFRLTSAELNDLFVYLQSIPENRAREPEFAAASAQTGQDLLKAKRCTGCHSDAFQKPRQARTLSDFAAALWNHPKNVKQQVALSPLEMRRIVGYLWSIRYFEQPGDALKGKQVYGAKGCAMCHDNASSGAPSLAGLAGRMDAYALMHDLTAHGPAMLRKVESLKLAWPQLTPGEMGDLIAYLNRPQPAPPSGL